MNTDTGSDALTDQGYVEVLAGIPDEYHPLAKTALAWIAYCRRPLPTSALLDACSIDWQNDPAFDETLRDHVNHVLRFLEPLVHLGSLPSGHKYRYYFDDTECAQLAAGFKEYLISDDVEQDFHLDEAETHFHIAQNCIAYLRRVPTAAEATQQNGGSLGHTFYSYAQGHWQTHQARAEELLGDRACLGLVEDFLLDEQTRKRWARSQSMTNPVDELGIGSALYWSCSLGLRITSERLLSRGCEVNEIGGKLGTPLQVAAWGGHPQLVERLLEAGAVVDYLHGYAGTALQAACTRSFTNVVDMLLRAGADVNACGGRDRNPALTIACHNDRVLIAETLLGHGADVNALGPYTKSICNSNSSGSLPRPGTGIRDHPEECGHHETALQAAAANGSESLVTTLLAHGADINAQGGSYGNALRAAIHFGRNEVIKLLLDRGANVQILPPHLLVDVNYTIEKAVAQRLFDAGVHSLRRERWTQERPLTSAVEGEGEIEEPVPDPTLHVDQFALFRASMRGRAVEGQHRRMQPYYPGQ